MSSNAFDEYEHLRQYQLHMQKLSNPETKVPSHTAHQPPKPQLQRVRQYQRNRRLEEIEHENEYIMHKLVKINRRKADISKSSPTLHLPKIRRDFNIPLYEEQNNHIAKKIIQSKPRVNSITDLTREKKINERKRNLSKYTTLDGVPVNRKKYLAELMLLKKMRVSEVIKSSR